MVDAVRASSLRIPDRIAVFDDNSKLSYRQLFAAIQTGNAAAHPSELVRWLATMHVGPSADENRTAMIVHHEGGERAVSHRELILDAMDMIVQHPVFDRDGCIGLSVSLESRLGAVAMAISLILGCTVAIFKSPGLGSVAEAIRRGSIQTWFLGSSQYAELEKAAIQDVAEPSPTFQRAFCDGKPPAPSYTQLVEWLGTERLSMQP